MNQADRIRQTAVESYILPARAAGRKEVTIRAGDLHGEMKLINALPAVCGALRSAKFELVARVKCLGIAGPANGANVYFRFDLDVQIQERDQALPSHRRQSSPPSPRAMNPKSEAIDLSGAIVLVSCVKSKLSRPAPARVLYCSDWFTKVRHIVETQNARWFVLSALHGLVPADREIAPYELTLNAIDVAGRRAWAAGVYRELEPELKAYNRVVLFAGLKYREFLVEPLQRSGHQVEVPMEGLAIGEQLSWLSAHQ